MKQFQHLRPLHKRLARLRRRRQRFRWATAASARGDCRALGPGGRVRPGLVLPAERGSLAAGVAAGVSLGRRDLGLRPLRAPWLGKREDETDMALLVQRQAGIDSDLVAALQFESGRCRKLGLDAVGNRRDRPHGRPAEESRRDGRHAAPAACPAAEAADCHRGRLGAVGLPRAGPRVGLLPATRLRFAALSLADAVGRRHGQRQDTSIFRRRQRHAEGGRTRTVRSGGPL